MSAKATKTHDFPFFFPSKIIFLAKMSLFQLQKCVAQNSTNNMVVNLYRQQYSIFIEISNLH